MSNEYIRVPEMPTGITRKRVGDRYYVYYVEERHYDYEKHQSRPKNVCIGKLHPKNPNYMIPNKNFDRFFCRETPLELKIIECQETIEACLTQIDQGYAILDRARERLRKLAEELEQIRNLHREDMEKSMQTGPGWPPSGTKASAEETEPPPEEPEEGT